MSNPPPIKPNWKAEQRALAEKTKLVRIHDKHAPRLKFSNCIMRRLPSGQLVREDKIR